jgi:hypothetical protein
MQIPAYQIHNVLKAYSRQVSQNKLNSAARSNASSTPVDKISISAEGKKQGIIDKVSADIVQKITTNDHNEKIEKALVDKLGQKLSQKIGFSETSDEDFSYYEINGNSKTKTAFSFNELDNAKKQMEDLAKDSLKDKDNGQQGEEK